MSDVEGFVRLKAGEVQRLSSTYNEQRKLAENTVSAEAKRRLALLYAVYHSLNWFRRLLCEDALKTVQEDGTITKSADMHECWVLEKAIGCPPLPHDSEWQRNTRYLDPNTDVYLPPDEAFLITRTEWQFEFKPIDGPSVGLPHIPSEACCVNIS